MTQKVDKKDFKTKIDFSLGDVKGVKASGHMGDKIDNHSGRKSHFTAFSTTEIGTDNRLISVFYGTEDELETCTYLALPLSCDKQTNASRNSSSSLKNTFILQDYNTPLLSGNTVTNALPKSYLERSRLSRFSVLIISVLIVHVAVIFAVNYFWVRPTVTVNKLTETKIQSYLYQVPKAEPQLESLAENKPSVATLIDEPDDKLTTNKQDMTAVKHREVNDPLQELKQDVSQEPKRRVKPEFTTELSQRSPEKTKSAARLSESSAISSESNSAKRFTQSYLAKQRASKLDELVVSSAANYSQKRSLSEMDGEMQELVFPEIDKYSKVVTTDHVLDPNRIIRKGDTCYRIVKIGDQINPYAETIGYPFNCGGDKVKKAINEAIAARLEKRMLGK